MKRSEFRYLETLRVRWAEVDMQKIVFNGHYLAYFDTAVAGYWRALALPYTDTMAALHGDLYVRKATLEYLASARYDDRLSVGMRCDRIGNSSLAFSGAVFRGEQLLVHGELLYVFADPVAQASRPVPKPLRELLLGYEAGDAPLTLRLGDWATLGAEVRALRQVVFADELQLPADLVSDGQDAGALHALAVNRFGRVVAAGRLSTGEQGQGQGQIGRIATLAAVRGAGLGQAVLAALQQAAAERGVHALQLHALGSAVPFFQAQGWQCEGPVFDAAGLPHQAMRRAV